MSSVELRNVSKRFSMVDALSDVSFSIKDGEFFVLLGPTGAGKTTTLRVIAALEKQDAGSVYFDGESADHLQPAERDVAMVFQQYSLYPTMTVWDNLAFPLRSPMRNVPQAEIEKRIADVAEKLRITHLLDRKTARLSGGEMQRVAIGRAIVRQPRIFLMDEPLSNLDAKLREALRVELQHLQKTQGDTTLLVTHDQIEALTMADRIAVLDRGRIIQIGTPAEIYDKPASTFVATLVGTPRINLLPVRRQDGSLFIENSELHIPVPTTVPLPEQLLLGIRPEDVRIAAGGPHAGQISLTEPLGVETIVHIQSGRQTLLSLMSGITNIKVGDGVTFSLFQERLHLFETDGRRIV
ncbi:MAG: ABC transporter ATP-binding protein [Anaerolineales bacterium]|nr:ABC transporter ATP-binding protein [Anaerolineales bacterium]